MKKALSLFLALFVLLTVFCLPGTAQADSALTAAVRVTVSDGSGNLVMAQELIDVTDADGDGTLTINDALIAAHEAKYTGGASAGYASAETEYGLSLTKLWGVENGGSYGYYLNNALAMSLGDPVKDGDCLHAYVYKDTVSYTDTFSYFDTAYVNAVVGDTLELTLYAIGFDENYNPVSSPVAGATVLVNGSALETLTDATGKIQITVEAAGDILVSASSDAGNLVPPACRVLVSVPGTNTTEAPTSADSAEATTAAPSAEETGCGSIASFGAVGIWMAAATLLVGVGKRKAERQ